MKKIIKCQCNSFSIVFFLLNMFFQNGQGTKEDFKVASSEKISSFEVANFINNNFDDFVSNYNEHCNVKWNATYIEKMFEITISDCGKAIDGFFLDYDSKNGYAVVADNFTIYDISIAGESPFLNIESNKYEYISSKGYYYLQGEKYLSVEPVNDQTKSEFEHTFYGKHYKGQGSDSVGCGDIINPDTYVKDKYGDGWLLENHNSLYTTGYVQYDLSCYIEHRIQKDKATGVEYVSDYSEGSCWFISAYNVLKYLASTQLTGMLNASTTTMNYDPEIEEPNLYSKFFDANGNNKTKKLYYHNNTSWVYQRVLRPDNSTPSPYVYAYDKLYADVRHLIDTKFKKVDGGTISESCSVIERIAEKYGYSINAVEDFIWGEAMNNVINNIDDCIPSLWSTSCDTYGSHTMAVFGYRHYSKTTGWWIFQHKETKTFFEIRDGWTSNPRYFDMSDYKGFAAIVTIFL